MRVGEAEEEEEVEEEDAQSISAIRAMPKRETHKKTNLVIAVLEVEVVVVVRCLAVATADEDEDEGGLPMVTSAGHWLADTIIMWGGWWCSKSERERRDVGKSLPKPCTAILRRPQSVLNERQRERKGFRTTT